MSLGTAEIQKWGPWTRKADETTLDITWTVESTDGSDDIATVQTASGLPAIGDYYTNGAYTDTSLRCRSVSVAPPDKTKKVFYVLTHYSTKSATLDEQPPPDNPLDRPTKTRFYSNTFTEIRQFDVNLSEFKSSAGEPYEPGLSRTTSDLVVQITRNLPSFDVATAARFKNTVNSTAFTLPTGEQVGAELGWIADITGDERFEYDVHYWEVTVIVYIRRSPGQISASRSATGIAFTPSPWDQVVPDMGMYQISNSERKLLLDSNKQPLTAPAYLNGSGVVLAPGAQAKFQQYQPYDRDDFTQLDLII